MLFALASSAAMPRKRVKWIERSGIHFNGGRVYAVANKETFEIEIDRAFHKSPLSILETEVHELRHLKSPEWTERKVTTDSRWLARELYRLGYRKQQ